ncbi:MAG TPA: DNA double-strand break repair nuclease NurA [Usitatibacter sp.]|nr:DNA double-strand break repair nuclease NurA [Usitatibacter sp.]
MIGEADEIQTRVRAKAERGEFLGQLLALSRNQSADLHEDFIRNLSALAVSLRGIFENEGLIQRFDRSAPEFWKDVSGKTVSFVDGGVARIDLPSAAPMGIRVGAYSVTIGDRSDARERFSTALVLVDELYSGEGWSFEDVFDDTQKMTDAARIIGEASVGLRQLQENETLSAVFLHGPLINPVAPYGTPGFPAFTDEGARRLFGNDGTKFSDRERHFVVLYRKILESFASIGKPVVGVVERSISPRPAVIFAHLDAMLEKGSLSPDDSHKIRTKLTDYRLNDSAVMGVMLARGEYVTPASVDRQQPANKWPNEWYSDIKAYPAARSTYIKSSDEAEPFRVEMHESIEVTAWVLEMVYQTARLLPNYGFPVGLDIVDKFAKVPNWMSQGIRKEHAVALLRNALKSGDPKVIEYAKKTLTARGRDWLFRPKA